MFHRMRVANIFTFLVVTCFVLIHTTYQVSLPYEKLSNENNLDLNGDVGRESNSSSDRLFAPTCKCTENGRCEGDNCICDPGYGKYESGILFWKSLICKKCDCGENEKKSPFNCTFDSPKKCSCISGYIQKKEICQIDDPCIALSPCQNGGTCIKVDSSKFKCICSGMTTGEKCETVMTTTTTTTTTVKPSTSTTTVKPSTTSTTVEASTTFEEASKSATTNVGISSTAESVSTTTTVEASSTLKVRVSTTREPESTTKEVEESSTTEAVSTTTTAKVDESSTTEPISTPTTEVEESSTTEPVSTTTTEVEESSTTEPVSTTTTEVEKSSTTEPVSTTTTAKVNKFSTTEAVSTTTAKVEGSSTTEPISTTTTEVEESSTTELVSTTTTPKVEESSTTEPVSTTTTPKVDESSTTEPISTSTTEVEESSTTEPDSTTTTKVEGAPTTEPISTTTAEVEESSTTEPVSTTTTEVEKSSTTEPVTAITTAKVDESSTTEPISTSTTEVEESSTTEPDSTTTTKVEGSSTTEPISTITAEVEESSTTEPVSTTNTEVEESSTTEPVSTTTTEVEKSSTTEPVSTTATEVEKSSTTNKVEASSTIKVEASTSTGPGSTTEEVEASTSIGPGSTTEKVESSTSIGPGSTTEKVESSTSTGPGYTTGEMEASTSTGSGSTTGEVEVSTSTGPGTTTGEGEASSTIGRVGSTSTKAELSASTTSKDSKTDSTVPMSSTTSIETNSPAGNETTTRSATANVTSPSSPTDIQTTTKESGDKWCLNEGKNLCLHSQCQYNEKNDFGYCKCPNGKHYDYSLSTCVEFDECPIMEYLCNKTHETCKNGKCQCEDGYGYDNGKCTAQFCNVKACGENEKCEEDTISVGNVMCTCKEGFFYNGKTCSKIDACKQPGMLNCSQICDSKTQTCGCVAGFEIQKDGTTCKTKDEKQLCKKNCGIGICIQEKGKDVCLCPPTHIATQGTCIDLCTAKKLPQGLCPSGSCVSDAKIGYKCKCSGKYKQAVNGVTCEKISMCSEGGKSEYCSQLNAVCVADDSEKGYSCACAKGEEQDAKGVCKGKCKLNKYLKVCNKKLSYCEIMPDGAAECKCPPAFTFGSEGKCNKLADHSYVGIFALSKEKSYYTTHAQHNTHTIGDFSIQSSDWFDKNTTIDMVKVRNFFVESVTFFYAANASANILKCEEEDKAIKCFVEIQFDSNPGSQVNLIASSCFSTNEKSDVCILPPHLILKKQPVKLEASDPCMKELTIDFCGPYTDCDRAQDGTKNFVCTCSKGYTSIAITEATEDHKTMVHTCKEVISETVPIVVGVIIGLVVFGAIITSVVQFNRTMKNKNSFIYKRTGSNVTEMEEIMKEFQTDPVDDASLSACRLEYITDEVR